MARKCRYCKTELPKVKDCTEQIQKKGFCSFDHAAKYGLEKARQQREREQKKAEKAERARIKEKKESFKTKGQWVKDAEREFNRFVRMRDHGQPCISCGNLPSQKRGGTMDAGHYRSKGSCPELRFEELNCHAQCVKCNRDLSGNVVEYRIRLKNKIGEKSLDWLEGSHNPKNYTIDDLKAIKAKYRKKANELQKEIDTFCQ